MHPQLEAALGQLVERALALATQDKELRTHLRGLAQAFLQITETSDGAATTVEASPVEEATLGNRNVAEQVAATLDQLDEVVRHDAEAGDAGSPAAAREPLPELTLGRSLPRAEPLAPSYPTVRISTVDFALVAQRCRLKAEGARWAAKRRKLIADGAEFYTAVEPFDRDIIARAREVPNCFLWMNNSSGPSPANLALFEQLAGCFDALADGAALVRQLQDEVDSDPADYAAALDLLAEAQSALRMAVAEMEGPVDSDQTEVFRWLKSTASENQIFIQRYMRLDDPANPARARDLIARLEAVDARVREGMKRARQRRKLLGKLRHKVSLLSSDPAQAAETGRMIAAIVHELIADGLPPSNRELRDLLLPAAEKMPELSETPRGFELAMREVDRHLAACPPREETAHTSPSKEVTEAANLLRGRSLALIGGDRRPGAYQAIKEAFGLNELIWIETREHESIDGFEAYVARSDVAAVMLAIRWSSHSYGEVRDFCEKHGKPLVRLPAGYNPNQVAAQIMSQCSERLR